MCACVSYGNESQHLNHFGNSHLSIIKHICLFERFGFWLHFPPFVVLFQGSSKGSPLLHTTRVRHSTCTASQAKIQARRNRPPKWDYHLCCARVDTTTGLDLRGWTFLAFTPVAKLMVFYTGHATPLAAHPTVFFRRYESWALSQN